VRATEQHLNNVHGAASAVIGKFVADVGEVLGRHVAAAGDCEPFAYPILQEWAVAAESATLALRRLGEPADPYIAVVDSLLRTALRHEFGGVKAS
jgi:hypothetical protein